MTDEIDELRERLEQVEDELGIEHIDPEALINCGDHCKTWFEIENGSVTYFMPVNAVDPRCDGFTDADTEYHYDYAVRVYQGEAESRANNSVRTGADPETMSYRSARDRLEELI